MAHLLGGLQILLNMLMPGNGQKICFGPSRPNPERNARDQDGPHLGAWMGPKRCEKKHMANLDGTLSDPGWDLDGPGLDTGKGLGGTPRDSNIRLGLSDKLMLMLMDLFA